ncbi:hypothetical protein D3C72_2420280 [compost metagenome]
MSGWSVTMSGQMYSFHSETIVTKATVAMLGTDTGTTIFQSFRQCPAPSISADSMIA